MGQQVAQLHDRYMMMITFHLLPSALQLTLVRVRFCCLGMFCSVNCKCSSMLLQSTDNHFPADKA